MLFNDFKQADQKIYGNNEPTGVYDYVTARAFALVLSVYHKYWIESR